MELSKKQVSAEQQRTSIELQRLDIEKGQLFARTIANGFQRLCLFIEKLSKSIPLVIS